MSLAELRRLMLQAKEETEKPKKKPKKVSKPKVSTVGSTVEKPKKNVIVKRSESGKIMGVVVKGITSDQLRAIYYILFGKTTRKPNREAIQDIIDYLQEVLRKSQEALGGI